MDEANNNETSARFDDRAAAQVGKYKGMVDGWVDKGLGLIGDHPWEKWIAVANRYIDMFLPAVLALAGVLAFLAQFIFLIRMDARFSFVIETFWVLVGTVFAMHLAPKALALIRSLIERGESPVIRPELAYILKVVLGLGGIVATLRSFFMFTSEGATLGGIFLLIAIVSSIVFTRPEFIGVKFGYPTNCVEEGIALVLLPVRAIFALFTPIVAFLVIFYLIYGIVCWFDSGMEASEYLTLSAIGPALIPLAAYVIYVVLVFTLDLYRAICSIPRKVDAVREVLEKSSK